MTTQCAERPDNAAYGRLTNPERYRPLHDAAIERVAQLAEEFQVERVNGVDFDLHAVRKWPGAPATKLLPTGGGAPFTITLTPFPRVMVSFGHHGEATFPQCGCDACDEDSAEEVRRMNELFDDLVAGRFSEERRRRLFRADTFEWEVGSRDGTALQRCSGTIDKDHSATPRGLSHWRPWTRLDRPSSGDGS